MGGSPAPPRTASSIPRSGPEIVATLWKDGQIVDLGTLGGIFSLGERHQRSGPGRRRGQELDHPTRITSGGALTEFPSPTQWHAALWQNGTIPDLGTLGDGLDAVAAS